MLPRADGTKVDGPMGLGFVMLAAVDNLSRLLRDRVERVVSHHG
jgi:hypothetical protein